MQLSRNDVIRLYGKHFFLIPPNDVPDVETESEEAQSSDSEEVANLMSGGTPVDWKMKPQARLAVVLPKEDFSNRTLTSQLKEWIDKAEIDTRFIGFGIMDETASSWEFSDMPVSSGIVFFDFGGAAPQKIEVKDKKLYLVGGISAIRADKTAVAGLIRILKDVRNTL